MHRDDPCIVISSQYSFRTTTVKFEETDLAVGCNESDGVRGLLMQALHIS